MLNIKTELYSIFTHIIKYPLGWFQNDHLIPTRGTTCDQPLILVHGFMSNAIVWEPIREYFDQLGWTNIYRYNYHVYRKNISTIVKGFNFFMENVLEAYDYDCKVSFVGHSLGGIIIRDWVTKFDNHVWVDKVVTIGSPHLGTKLAHLGKLIPFRPRNLIRELVINSNYLKTLNNRRQPINVKWCTIYSDSDEFISPRVNARYPDHWKFTEVVLKDIGHVYLVYTKQSAIAANNFLIGITV